MSHQDLQPHHPHEVPKCGFFDSMLMYGWLADRQQKVTKINKSLYDWLVRNGHKDVADEVRPDTGVAIKDMFASLLRDRDDPYDSGKELGEIVETEIAKIIEDVESLVREDVLAEPRRFELLGIEKRISRYIIQTNLQVIELDGTVLAGFRIVTPGAIRMNSDNNRDRVDIITVCQIVNEELGWRVVGLQGQLQQSWLRVKAGIEAGTQAGTVGLMGRNMSHNIGSHALFYLEAEESDLERRLFYRYLRERMELLAGFSTVLSLSSTTETLGKIIDPFIKNTALLQRIAKSERVQSVYINLQDTDREVALPAGILGAQALYIILENNIRDSAKHGRSNGSNQASLTITVDVHEPEDQELKDEFIEVVVSDDRGNYAHAGPRIQNAFSQLRIVNDLGRLELGNWGIKERFIAAAILRGIRLEDISVQHNNTNQIVNLILTDYKPDILRVVNVNGNLGWAFYLMKPKDILLITNTSDTYAPAVTVHDMKWLRENIDDPAVIRHQFVVARLWDQEQIDELVGFTDKLPHRVFVHCSEGTSLPGNSHFVPIDRESLKSEPLSPALLYSRWVDWLVKEKKPKPPPPSGFFRRLRSLFSDDEKFAMPETIFCNGSELRILSPDDTSQSFCWESKEKISYRPQRPVILFDRHGSCVKSLSETKQIEWTDESKALAAATVHYEPHISSDSVRQLHDRVLQAVRPGQTGEDHAAESSTMGFACLEAALIKILIVDERLDPLSRSTEEHDLHNFDTGWTCTKNELFQWKGVDIRGSEYGADKLPGREMLIEWVKGKGYDFLLLHKGIVDKLIEQVTTSSLEESKIAMHQLFLALKEHVDQLIIHSGRMSMRDLPEGCKFMALSNVDTWLRNNYSKVEIVQDICLLRRV